MTIHHNIIDLSLDHDLYDIHQHKQYQPCKTLQQDLILLYKSQCMYDIIFQYDIHDHNSICTAHACVLVGRSQYFYELLTQHNDNIQSLPYIITVSPHIEASVLCTIMKYIYTNKFDLSVILRNTPDQSPSLEPCSPVQYDDATHYNSTPSDHSYLQWKQLIELYNSQQIISQLIELSILYQLYNLYKLLTTRLSLTNTNVRPYEYSGHIDNTDDIHILSMKRLLYGEHRCSKFTTNVLIDNMNYNIDPVLFAIRSPYFYTMFNGSFSESQRPTTIELISMSQYEFQLVRSYIYTDILDTQVWYKQINLHVTTPQHNKSIHVTISNKQLKLIYSYVQLLSLCKYLSMNQLHESIQYDIVKQLLDIQTCCILWIICGSVDNDNSMVADIVCDSCLSFFQSNFIQCSMTSAFKQLPQYLLKQALDSGCIDASFDDMCTQLYEWARYNCSNTSNDDDIQLLLRQLLPPTTLFNQRCKRRIMGERDDVLERILSSMGLI